MRPFVRLFGGDGEAAVFDGDSHALLCFKAGMLDPSSGELHPVIKRRVVEIALRSPLAIAP